MSKKISVILAVFIIASAVGPIGTVAADQSTVSEESTLSLTLLTDRGDTLTATGTSEMIAEGQSVRARIEGSGLGSGTHTIRLVEGDAFSEDVLESVSLHGDSDAETITLSYSTLDTQISNDWGAADLEARWVDNGETLLSSDEQNVDLAETTVYIESYPESVSERESAAVSFYGWSEHDSVHFKLMEENVAWLEDDTQVETKNLDVSGDEFSGTVTVVPSQLPEDDETVELYLEPMSADDGPSTETVTIQITPREENDPPNADAGSNKTVSPAATVTLDGSDSSDPDSDSLSYSWTQTTGPSVTLDDAESPTPSFTAPTVETEARLGFELTVTDGHGHSDTAAVTITVQPETESGVDVAIEPPAQTVPPGETTQVDVTVDDVSGGVGAFNLSIGVSNTSVATITGATLGGDPDVSTVAVDSDNSTVDLTAALADTANTGMVTIATVRLSAERRGTSQVELAVTSLGDESGETYEVASTTGGTITVAEADGIDVPIGDFDGPPTDPDEDGRYEDINGDGAFTIVDVQALFANRNSNAVQDKSSLFDFNGDGSMTVVDVQRLFVEATR